MRKKTTTRRKRKGGVKFGDTRLVLAEFRHGDEKLNNKLRTSKIQNNEINKVINALEDGNLGKDFVENYFEEYNNIIKKYNKNFIKELKEYKYNDHDKRVFLNANENNINKLYKELEDSGIIDAMNAKYFERADKLFDKEQQQRKAEEAANAARVAADIEKYKNIPVSDIIPQSNYSPSYNEPYKEDNTNGPKGQMYSLHGGKRRKTRRNKLKRQTRRRR